MNQEQVRPSAVRRVARRAGGFRALAQICGVDRSTVSHWDRPRAKKGRGGSIPDVYYPRILAAIPTLQLEELINV